MKLWLGLIFLTPFAFAGGDLDELATWMQGSFSSEEQSVEDQEYFDIRLEMARIWEDRKDGVWLYVEQAAATALERPYRQRIYHVYAQDDGTFASEIYTLEKPEAFIGGWKDASRFAGFGPEKLTVRKGCKVTLKKASDGSYVGGTHEADCESSLRGASYATTEIRLTADTMISWDRGFDSENKHVWGAEKGGYIFKRKTTSED